MSKGSKLLPFILFLSLSYSSSSSDTLKPSESLAGNQTLISAGRIFEFGFFSPAGSNNLYLGIWYFNQTDKTVIWIANRDSPARNSSVSLSLKSSGQIVLSEEGASSDVWSSNQTRATNPILQLLDSGNLVVRETDDSNSEDYLWRSFDYPTDTLLAGQKLGWDKKTGLDRYLTSWKSSNDPSSGDYTFRLARTGDPEILVLKDGTQKIYRTGPWVGERFSGVPPMNTSPTLNFSFLDNPEEVSYEVDESNPNIKSRLVMEPTGSLHRYAWVEDSMTWSLYWFGPKDQCDQYMACGAFGVCDASEFFVCNCTHGFQPRNPSAWAQRDASNGCVRKTKLDCGTDGFAVLRGMKLPDSGEVTVDKEKGLEECAETCKKDCDCTAYSNWRMVNGVGSGCLIWKGDLKDMRTYSYSGQNLYVRLAASDVPPDTISDSGKNKNVGFDVGVSVGVVMLVLAVAVFFAWRKKKRREQWRSSSRVSRVRTTQRNQDFLLNGSVVMSKRDLPVDNDPDDLELPLYDFDAVVVATNDFSDENKLGEGGFGYVYKGVLKEGEETAIKRLSKESGQGTEEFKNEVKLIAKLQHRNLVRLLGCCVDREEKILIYEYLSNRSLDTVLFHKERCFLLDWQRRFNIICGIARGLQYLHHDSRVRIIHRDLKASNILMDRDMNPKISDFGMARIFGGDETGSKNTRRVVGTYGYMAPEYAMDGVFSIKSDVFGFGVLVLEIITGKKNTGFYNAQNELNLLGYAWRMWKEGKGSGLLDSSIGETYSVTEVERCIQIGLLCVQERAEERPTMLSVVVLLNSETAALPQPKPPGFCLGRRQVVETDSSSSQQDETFSVNQVTVTMIDGR